SLLPQILDYLHSGRTASLSFTPGPVHRLDRNTTGLIVYAKTLLGARTFSQLLHTHALHKRYLALLSGSLDRNETWSDVLRRDYHTHTTHRAEPTSQTEPQLQGPPQTSESGLPAETMVIPLCGNGSATLAVLEPKTGRTHQIRAQAALHGHPLAGDSKYGAPATSHPYILHAFQLAWEDPNPERVVAPLPQETAARLTRLFGAQQLDKLLRELGL
ncbi:MAG: RNA pseudouridine synthase, partial [Spirochaetaceae bacterium]